jgi:hypothetical protein
MNIVYTMLWGLAGLWLVTGLVIPTMWLLSMAWQASISAQNANISSGSAEAVGAPSGNSRFDGISATASANEAAMLSETAQTLAVIGLADFGITMPAMLHQHG